MTLHCNVAIYSEQIIHGTLYCYIDGLDTFELQRNNVELEVTNIVDGIWNFESELEL